MKNVIQRLTNFAEQFECEAELEMAHDLDKVCYLLDQSVDLRQVSVASILRCHTGAIRQQMVQTSGKNRECFRENLKHEAVINMALVVKKLNELNAKVQGSTDDNILVDRCSFMKTLAQIILSNKGG